MRSGAEKTPHAHHRDTPCPSPQFHGILPAHVSLSAPTPSGGFERDSQLGSPAPRGGKVEFTDAPCRTLGRGLVTHVVSGIRAACRSLPSAARCTRTSPLTGRFSTLETWENIFNTSPPKQGEPTSGAVLLIGTFLPPTVRALGRGWAAQGIGAAAGGEGVPTGCPPPLTWLVGPERLRTLSIE